MTGRPQALPPGWGGRLQAWLAGLRPLPLTCVTLQATVREFTAAHPDFDRVRMGTARVAPRLLAGKPAWAGGSSVASAASFQEWFRDVPGVNRARPFATVVRNGGPAGPRVFCYPPDPQLDGAVAAALPPGRDPDARCRGCTLELHTSFVYRGGELLSYGSDADLWVFIDGHLVVDLGGVHPYAACTIDLDALAGRLGLRPGGCHDIALFFADRDAIGSSLHFSLPTPLAAALPAGRAAGGG